MIKKDNKVYATKNYKVKDEVCKTKWCDSVIEKKFPIPVSSISLKNKKAIDVNDMVSYEGLIGDANYINSSPKPNTEAFVDIELKEAVFVCCRPIKSGEEITFTLHYSCFDNVKIQ